MTDVQGQVRATAAPVNSVGRSVFHTLPIVIAAFYARGNVKATDVHILAYSPTLIKLRITSANSTHRWIRGGEWGWKQWGWTL